MTACVESYFKLYDGLLMEGLKKKKEKKSSYTNSRLQDQVKNAMLTAAFLLLLLI